MTQASGRRLLWIGAALYAVCFTALSWHICANFLDLSYDLGLYCQALNRFLAGETYVSLNGTRFLGIHAHFLHFLCAPLALVSAPYGLLLLQSVALALVAPALYRLAARAAPPAAAAALALAWLVNPLVHAANLFEYHPEVPAAALLAWALVGLEERRTLLWLGLALLCAAAKETNGLLVALLAGAAALAGAPRRFWLPALAGGLVFFLGGALLVRAGNDNGLDALGSFYPGLAADPLGYLWRILAEPGWGRTETLLLVWGGFAFLPLLRPGWAAAGFGLLLLPLLAGVENMHRPLFHYHLLPLAALAAAAAAGLARAGRLAPPLAGLALAASLGLQFYRTPAPDGQLLAEPAFASPVAAHPLFSLPRAALAQRRLALRGLLDSLPPQAELAAPIPLLAHLADRRGLHFSGFLLAERIEHSARPLPFPPALVYFVSEEEPAALLQATASWPVETLAARLARQGSWEIAGQGGGLWVWQRRRP